MIPISLITIQHAISNYSVDVPDFQSDLRVACWVATELVMDHIKMPDVEDIPAAWLHDSIPAGFPLDEHYIPRLPSIYSTDSPQVEKYVIIPGKLLAPLMLAVGEVFQNRESGTANVLSDTVIHMLDSFDVYTLV